MLPPIQSSIKFSMITQSILVRSVIPQVGSQEDQVYANLTPTLGGRESVSKIPSVQGGKSKKIKRKLTSIIFPHCLRKAHTCLIKGTITYAM